MYNSVIKVELSKCFVSSSTLVTNEMDNIAELAESITQFGLVDPLIVQESGTMYEVIHGRRRYYALKDLGVKEVPVIIRKFDNGIDLWLELKLQQEGVGALKYSELASLIYKYYGRVKHQGKKQVFETEQERFSSLLSSKKFSVSPRTISRYLRIYELSNSLKQVLDMHLISMRASIELSYIPTLEQELIADYIRRGSFVSWAQCKEIRMLSEKGTLLDNIDTVLNDKIREHGFKPMTKLYKKYDMSRYTTEEVEQVLDKALNMYFSENGFKVNWRNQ